jgi:hypothetical protein
MISETKPLVCPSVLQRLNGPANFIHIVRFEVLKAASTKMAVFSIIKADDGGSKHLKRRKASTRLHGAITQKTVIFIHIKSYPPPISTYGKVPKSISGRYWWNQFCYMGVKYGHLKITTEKYYRLWKWITCEGVQESPD